MPGEKGKHMTPLREFAENEEEEKKLGIILCLFVKFKT